MSKSKCPSRGSVFNEEEMLEKQRFVLVVIQLKNKNTKLLMTRTLFCLRKLTGGYLIVFLFLARKDEEAKLKGVNPLFSVCL